MKRWVPVLALFSISAVAFGKDFPPAPATAPDAIAGVSQNEIISHDNDDDRYSSPSGGGGAMRGGRGGPGGGSGGGMGGMMGAGMGAGMGLGMMLNPVGAIVNLGVMAWGIVENNAPAGNVSLKSASALPQGASNWQQLTGWQMPVVKVFEQNYTNKFGKKAIQFKYRIRYTYGGGLDGKGKFLTGIAVEPVDLKITYGYKFSVQAQVTQIINTGTVDDPIATVELVLDMKRSSLFQEEEVSLDYYISGDGTIRDVSNGT